MSDKPDTPDTPNTIDTLAQQIATCTLCPLHTGRTNAVAGDGSPTADIMFIGEGPGQHEDEQGIPFVGRSGQYLNYLLDLIDMKREDVFITNMVKCRPPNNRDPKPDEMAACKPFLDQQIALIDPAVIVTVGRFSMSRYFPKAKISAIHGQPKYEDGRAYYPIYHPAAALRNSHLKLDMEADIKRLLEVIAEVKRRRATANAPESPTPPDEDTPSTPPTQLQLL